MSKNKAYTHVSLFSGAGGLDIGLEQAGFHTVWANDFNHDACETHRLWSNATVVEGNIGKVDYDTIPDCDIASFGFPCQGFSLSGLRKVDDSRNILYRHCVKLVEKKQPKLFLAENVKCLALAKSIDTLQLCYGPYFNSLKVESLWSKAFELMDDVTRSEIVEDLKLFQRAWRKYKEEKPVKDAQKILDAISELFGEEVTSK